MSNNLKSIILYSFFSLATVTLGAVKESGAPLSSLPSNVRSQLENQKEFLKHVSIQYDETLFRGDKQFTSTNTAYFEEKSFLVNEGMVYAFDGDVLWTVTINPNPDKPIPEDHYTLHKIYTKKAPTFSFVCLYWTLTYLDAAGIYAPKYPRELKSFEGLRPLATHLAENGNLLEAKEEGANFRITGYVDDWVLANARATDPDTFRKNLQRTPADSNIISNEVKLLGHMRAMSPQRKISMLLDSKHGYFPIEREDFSADGHLIMRFKVEDWKYFESVSMWLPSRCIVLCFANPYTLSKFSDEPVQKYVITLNTADFSQKHAEFNLLKVAPYNTPGTWVYDEAIMEKAGGVETPVILTVSADGRLLHDRVSGGHSLEDMKLRRFWILCLIVVLGIPPLVALIRRLTGKGI
jgi:hypothetical protein